MTSDNIAEYVGENNQFTEKPVTEYPPVIQDNTVTTKDYLYSNNIDTDLLVVIVLMATRRRISPGRFHRSLLPISMISSIKRPVFLLTVAVFMNRTQFWITVNGYAFLFRSSFRMGVTGLKYCA